MSATMSREIVRCRVGGCEWSVTLYGSRGMESDALVSHLLRQHTHLECAELVVSGWLLAGPQEPGVAVAPAAEVRPGPRLTYRSVRGLTAQESRGLRGGYFASAAEWISEQPAGRVWTAAEMHAAVGTRTGGRYGINSAHMALHRATRMGLVVRSAIRTAGREEMS